MEKILTLIIPSYNMEKYLDKCISSLIVDALPKMEVLVVNDGSKDSTLQIAKAWNMRYPESIFFIDKPNGNYGSCINAGLAVAHGKYVKVLDADDSFETGNLDRYLTFLEKSDSDLVISDYAIVDESDTERRRVSFRNGATPSLPGVFDDFIKTVQDFDFEMHAVAYRRSIFERFSYRQTEGISYTDQEWMFKPMAYVETVSYFPEVVYRYLVGREGQTVDPKVSHRMVTQTMAVCDSMLRTYREIRKDVAECKLDYLDSRLMKKIPSVYRIILLKSKGTSLYKELVDFDENIRLCNVWVSSRLDREKIKFIPFRYIPYWRRNCRDKEGFKVPGALRFFQSVITRLI